MMDYIYLWLNIGTLAFPLLLSFDRKVAFFRRWYALFPAIAFAGGIFIIWDVWFTEMGVWSFNPAYLTGIYLLNLPLEEWLFFLTIPYACVFIYDCLNAYMGNKLLLKQTAPLSLGIGSVLLLIGLSNLDLWYTSITFISMGLLLILVSRSTLGSQLGKFYRAYLVHLIPFFTVNGVLTALPVVMYNDAENVGIRLGTVPAEDPIYSMLLLFLTITVYEFIQAKFPVKRAFPSVPNANIPSSYDSY
ncbi:MAG: lycopene cyclase domain-containing protein [Bacteroidota bacterium]